MAIPGITLIGDRINPEGWDLKGLIAKGGNEIMMSKIKRKDTRDLNGHMKCQGVSKRDKPCNNYFCAGWGELPEHYT